MNYETFFSSQLQVLRDEGRYRNFAHLEKQVGSYPKAKTHHLENSSEVTVWCSNDYLGMGQHPEVIGAMIKAAETFGAGAGGTRNISGTTILHVELEKELAKLHQQEAALIFTSGYVANETTLSTLGRYLPNCAIFSDSLNHASMIQGIRHSGAQKYIFNHNDPEDLNRLLAMHPKDCPKIIAFESIYSMEGDVAPIKEICDVADAHGAMTYIDEVHGVGLYGENGGGIAEQQGMSKRLSIIQGTFGKAIGLIGGYITGSKNLIDFVRSFAPGFIFTTALPPAVVAGILASLKHLKKAQETRKIHQKRVLYLKQKLKDSGIPFYLSHSHIVPVIVGDAALCKKITDRLMKQYNIYVQPINYPTVPKGTERIRLAPTPLHTEEMIDHLVTALSEIWTDLILSKDSLQDSLRTGTL